MTNYDEALIDAYLAQQNLENTPENRYEFAHPDAANQLVYETDRDWVLVTTVDGMKYLSVVSKSLMPNNGRHTLTTVEL